VPTRRELALVGVAGLDGEGAEVDVCGQGVGDEDVGGEKLEVVAVDERPDGKVCAHRPRAGSADGQDRGRRNEGCTVSAAPHLVRAPSHDQRRTVEPILQPPAGPQLHALDLMRRQHHIQREAQRVPAQRPDRGFRVQQAREARPRDFLLQRLQRVLPSRLGGKGGRGEEAVGREEGRRGAAGDVIAQKGEGIATDRQAEGDEGRADAAHRRVSRACKGGRGKGEERGGRGKGEERGGRSEGSAYGPPNSYPCAPSCVLGGVVDAADAVRFLAAAFLGGMLMEEGEEEDEEEVVVVVG